VSVARLAIGSAQLGMSYGLGRRDGAQHADDPDAILARAVDLGIDWIDTAPDYGDAEDRIGRFLRRFRRTERIRITSKLPSMRGVSPEHIGQRVDAEIQGSLRRLGVERVAVYLIHDHTDVERHGAALISALAHQVGLGRAQAVGVSVYSPADLAAIEAYPELAVVQHPYNLFDRRLVTSGAHRRLRSASRRLHLRSVFLQGLLLMRPDELPPFLTRASTPLESLRKWLDDRGLTPLQAALACALGPASERIVVGVDSVRQLDEIAAAAKLKLSGESIEGLKQFALPDNSPLIDPRLWKR
jgi:aryl-alcohol dehydrogenase-like predicted oxidoreductase